MRLREGAVMAVLSAALAAAQAEPVAAPALSAGAVRAAASAVEADPLLPGREKTKVLRSKRKGDEAEKPDKGEGGDESSWWEGLIGNLSGGLRVAMWLVGAALLIAVLLRLRDWFKGQSGAGTLAALPPTHVGSLDIRPESLPDDIGAAARALGQRGEQRAALSLLYRGALSRLVHGHGVPIRAASTERECLALAAPRLAPAPQAFLAQLVAGWQAVAYARRELPAQELEALCQGFDMQLAAATSGARA